MFRLVKAAFAAIGFDIRPLRNLAGVVVGMEIRRRGASPAGGAGEIVNTEISGKRISFFVRNEADVIQRSHKNGRFYEEEELEIIASNFSGGVFVDIGTNIGNHTIFAAKILGATKIICVEPNPEAYQILRVNIALNDLSNIVVHHPVGLSDKKERATAIVYQDNLGGTRFDASSGEGDFQLMTGDDLLDGIHVDFIKIDTEGFEIKALRGLYETISRCQPVIFIEVDQENSDEFMAILPEIKYQIVDHYCRYAGAENYLLRRIDA